MTTTRLEIFLSASNLADMDVFSKSDPCVFVWAHEDSGKVRFVGHTEYIK